MSDSSDPMSAEAELKRIDHTATIWFPAALLTAGFQVAAIVLSGWRPSELPPPGGLVWWIGAVLVGVGLAGIGYAGCPIYWGNVRIAHLQKSIAIRGGLVCFLFGSFMAFVALMTG